MYKYLSFLLILLCLISCQSNGNITNNTEELSPLRICMPTRDVPEQVHSISGIITRNDYDSISRDFTISADSCYADFGEISSGVWHLSVTAYNIEGIALYFGEADISIVPNQDNHISLQLNPLTGHLEVIITWGENEEDLGDRIVFQDLVDGIKDIYLYNPYTNNIDNITETSGISEYRPRLSPDGKKILFCRQNTSFHSLVIYDTETNTEQVINDNQELDIRYAGWSPEGDKIICKANNDLHIYHFSTNTFDQITFDGNDQIDNESKYTHPSWSSDGEWICYYDTPKYIYKIRPDGTDKTCLNPNENMDCKMVKFSPDSQRIVFYGRFYSGTWDLFLADINGNNLVQLTNTPDIDENRPVWSPDGNQILFSRWNWSEHNLYKVNIDGSNYSQVLDYSIDIDYPHWR